MGGIASSNPTEGDLQFFSFTRISFKTFHGFAWFLKSKTIYIHRTYIHTSIIYVTKKVIHWGANHPNDDGHLISFNFLALNLWEELMDIQIDISSEIEI